MSGRLFCARGMDEVSHGLWVGGLVEAREDRGEVFDCLATCIRAPGPFPGVVYWTEAFPDDELIPRYRDMAVSLARRVADWRREGLKVLVTCNYGANRSALVAGLAMKMAGEGSGDEVIAKVRAYRKLPRDHGPALDNFSFCAFLRDYNPAFG